MTLHLADDDPITLDPLAACLEQEGFRTLRARDGEEAFPLWEQHHPGLLCLDIMMPRVDGDEVCRRGRTSDPAVPVLFLSAKSEEIDVVVGLQLGADDFIRKPFGRHELLARLHAALRRSRRSDVKTAHRHFVLHDLTVFPLELRAGREGTDLELTPREVSILQTLHDHAGEVVARDTLLERCWGVSYFPESRTLDQHIAKRRKKIEVDAENPQIIETVRGVGCRHRER